MCLNYVIISVLYGSQSNLIEIAAGKRVAVMLFRGVASCSIFIIFFYVPMISGSNCEDPLHCLFHSPLQRHPLREQYRQWEWLIPRGA